jgi:hypothetical protein
MHVVTLGTKKELMKSALNLADRITVLYEPWEELRIAPFRKHADHWGAVRSCLCTESLLSGLYHTGAINHPIDVIVPAHETAVVPAAFLGALLDARSLSVEVAMRCRDKALQKSAWAQAGVATTRWVVIRDALAQNKEIEHMVRQERLVGPFVIKPLAFHSSRNTHIVADSTQLAMACETIAQAEPSMRCLLIEQFTSGKEWQLDGIFYEGRLRALSISNYLQPVIENRQGKCLASITYRPHAYPELYKAGYEFARKAVAALGLHNCVFHMEAFTPKDDFQFVAGELAARTPGGYTTSVLYNMLGLDLWDAHLKTCMGIEPYIPPMLSNHSWGYTHLACEAGKVNRLRVEDVQNIPGVMEADVYHPYGQVMPDMRENSSVTLGYALLRGENEEDCKQAILRVQGRVAEIHARSHDISERTDYAI